MTTKEIENLKVIWNKEIGSDIPMDESFLKMEDDIIRNKKHYSLQLHSDNVYFLYIHQFVKGFLQTLLINLSTLKTEKLTTSKKDLKEVKSKLENLTLDEVHKIKKVI